MLHPAIAALPHEYTRRRDLPVLLNDYFCLSAEFIQSTGRKLTAYYTHYKFSTAQTNSNVVAACFNVRHNKQVAIWRQVPSTTYAAAASGKVNFSYCTP